MRHLLILMTLVLASSCIFAQTIPTSSSFDQRMQNISYNAEDVTIVRSKLGFVTTIIFAEDEQITKAISGFETGWRLEPFGNKLFLYPLPVEQTADLEDDQNISLMHEPTAKEWHTNLFVSTNKRDYSFDLELADQDRNVAHIVRFCYGDTMLQEQIEHELANTMPQYTNLNYFFKQKRDSDNIIPDFAYDDGKSTYFGFSELKNIPSPFLLQNGKEQVANFSIEQKGEFKVMKVPNLGKRFVLRYGKMIVGILNKSFGKYVAPYSTTNSLNIKREDHA